MRFLSSEDSDKYISLPLFTEESIALGQTLSQVNSDSSQKCTELRWVQKLRPQT